MIIEMALLMHMNKSERWHTAFKAMGTDVEIDIVAPLSCEDSVSQMMQEMQVFFEKTEQIFSRFREKSELCRVNENSGSYVQVSQDFIAVMELAMMYHEYTGGVFDPRIYDTLIDAGYDRDFHTHDLNQVHKKVNKKFEVLKNTLRHDISIDQDAQMIMVQERIDLSGIVKGWAVDQARDLMVKSYNNFMIDAGGDMWVQGVNENEKPWYIGIEDIDEEKLLLCVDGEGIATSGTTRRQWTINGQQYHHLINPQQVEHFSFDLSMVTVIADSVMHADILAKTLFLMEQHTRESFIKKHAIKTIIIENDRNINISQYAQENIVQ